MRVPPLLAKPRTRSRGCWLAAPRGGSRGLRRWSPPLLTLDWYAWTPVSIGLIVFKLVSHVTIAWHPRLVSVSDAIRGCYVFFHTGRFDRPLVKCYKSSFCAALASRLRGASPAILGVVSDRRAAASSRWNLNNSLFGRAQWPSAEKVCRKRPSLETIAQLTNYLRRIQNACLACTCLVP